MFSGCPWQKNCSEDCFLCRPQVDTGTCSGQILLQGRPCCSATGRAIYQQMACSCHIVRDLPQLERAPCSPSYPSAPDDQVRRIWSFQPVARLLTGTICSRVPCLRLVASITVWLLPLPNPASYPSLTRRRFLINILHPKLSFGICFQRSQTVTVFSHDNIVQLFSLFWKEPTSGPQASFKPQTYIQYYSYFRIREILTFNWNQDSALGLVFCKNALSMFSLISTWSSTPWNDLCCTPTRCSQFWL